VPAVWYVTNGNDSGSGSLRVAYESAESAGNGQEIIIDEPVTEIELDIPLDSGAMNVTIIEITGENPSARPVIKASIAGAHQFQNHTGNNGVTIILEHLKFEDFGTTGNGGAIKTVAPLYLVNCDFTFTEAEGDGGAIFSEYSIDMEGCAFTFNDAGDDGGRDLLRPGELRRGDHHRELHLQ